MYYSNSSNLLDELANHNFKDGLSNLEGSLTSMITEYQIWSVVRLSEYAEVERYLLRIFAPISVEHQTHLNGLVDLLAMLVGVSKSLSWHMSVLLCMVFHFF